MTAPDANKQKVELGEKCIWQDGVVTIGNTTKV